MYLYLKMAKSIPDVRFELTNVYKTYVDQLRLSSTISNILLDSTNIDSAGEQIESSLRILLRNLLPDRVSVTHGYLVDKKMNISYQQDILLAESFYTKSLIKSLDGTEFFPYEAIFASGEVKKTWSHEKLIPAIKSIKRNRGGLERFPIPADVMSTGSNFIKVSEPITESGCRNPLFCFTFSIDYDSKYDEGKLMKIYAETDKWKYLPNISVILNRGIVVCVDKEKLSAGELSIMLYPEFIDTFEKYSWILLTLSPEQNLAYLIFTLTQHINDTILEKVSSMDYGKSLIEISPSSIHPLT